MAQTVKLTDGGSNTITFDVDSYNEVDMDFDIYDRSSNNTLLHYNKGEKKKFTLGVKNISSANKTTLETIKNLRIELDFYRDSASSKTADVFWTNEFDLHTPSDEHRFLVDKVYQGTIVLEEV